MHAFSAQLAACMLADQMADSVIGWMRWIRWMVSWVGAHIEVGTHMVGTHMVGTNGGDHRCSTQKLGWTLEYLVSICNLEILEKYWWNIAEILDMKWLINFIHVFTFSQIVFNLGFQSCPSSVCCVQDYIPTSAQQHWTTLSRYINVCVHQIALTKRCLSDVKPCYFVVMLCVRCS